MIGSIQFHSERAQISRKISLCTSCIQTSNFYSRLVSGRACRHRHRPLISGFVRKRDIKPASTQLGILGGGDSLYRLRIDHAERRNSSRNCTRNILRKICQFLVWPLGAIGFENLIILNAISIYFDHRRNLRGYNFLKEAGATLQGKNVKNRFLQVVRILHASAFRQ